MKSLIRTSKIATLENSLVRGLLGKLATQELTVLNEQLKVFLQVP
jgi:mRNA interferase MazF